MNSPTYFTSTPKYKAFFGSTLLLILIIRFTALAQIDPQDVEIVRDQFGVPHIFGKTDADAAYGLAWAHAEDDFKTLQLTLLGANQQLGRYLGKAGAQIDYVAALLRCETLANVQYDKFSEDYLKVLAGYTDGMNAYAREHPGEVLVKNFFPITEMQVLNAYALSLSVFNGADGVIRDLFDNKIPNAPSTDDKKGSNAFAISRKKTTNGKTFLNVNSHQPLEGPVAWYEAHMVSEEGWNALGGLFPGGATIFHGTNEYLGWAHTVNYPDKIDVFELELNPEDPLQYRFDDEWKTLEQEEVTLTVKLFLGIKIKVKRDAYWSVYGPVVKNDNGAFAFHMGTFDELRAPEQWYRMNKATNWQQFKAALEMMALPSINIVYADREDNIFHVSHGKLPIRNSAFDWSTTLPGNTSATLTTDYHAFDELPMTLNPEAGFVFNTNNSAFSNTEASENPDPANYPETMGYRVFENNRSLRFLQLIGEQDRLSYEDFKRIKYDQQLPDSLAYPIRFEMLWDLKADDHPTLAPVITILQNWDRSAAIDNVGAAQFAIFYEYLREDILKNNESLYQTISLEKCLEALAYTQDYLIEHFGKLTIKLGDYQRHTRGKVNLPISGIRDVIATMTSKPWENGRVRAHQGESYIMLAQYSDEGVEIETINAYGASSKPGSPHYTDQMEMFVNKELKPMTLDKETIYQKAKKIYHPK